MATRTLRKDETACNNCGQVFRGQATNEDAAANPLCKKCTKAQPQTVVTPPMGDAEAEAIAIQLESGIAPFGQIGDAHHRVDQGQCACGVFCHTYGKGDDRKLHRHITIEGIKPQTRNYRVVQTIKLVVHVEAGSRTEAIAKVKTRQFEGEVHPTERFTANAL